MEDEIKLEAYVKGSPEPLTIEATSKIIDQMKKCVCHIKYNGKDGTGFFTKIPYISDTLTVLCTNNHIISGNDLKNCKIITLYINNRNIEKNILINENRFFYTNKILDVSIIEIKEKEDQIEDFLELDDNIKSCLQMDENQISGYLTNAYSNKSIYILNYQEGENIKVSYGPSPELSITKIKHKCSTKEGSSGSPILLSSNGKVIGIHYGYPNNRNYNEGTIIIFPIINFYQDIQNNIIKVKEDRKKIQDEVNNSNILNKSIYKSTFNDNNKNNDNISKNQINNNPNLNEK